MLVGCEIHEEQGRGPISLELSRKSGLSPFALMVPEKVMKQTRPISQADSGWLGKRRAKPLPLVLAGLCFLLSMGAKASVIREVLDADGVYRATNVPSRQAPKARQAAPRKGEPQKNTRSIPIRETNEWDHHIAAVAVKYNLPAPLIRAVIVAESNFDPFAVSHAGAQGLMQLMPKTAEEMFVADTFDPIQNISGGARYLRILANMFNGDLVKTLAAYNAGPSAVKRAGGVPNYKETKEYVERVVRLFKAYQEEAVASRGAR